MSITPPVHADSRCVTYMDSEIRRLTTAQSAGALSKNDNRLLVSMLFMRAYMPLTWVLMARTSEVRGLTNSMLVLDAPHHLFPDREDLRHVEIRLTFRKNNQADPNRANVYQLYDVEDEPAAHVQLPLRNWFTFVRNNSFGDQAKEPTALVFPDIDAAGKPVFTKAWGKEPFRRIFNTVVDGAGIAQRRWGTGRFMSHSLRRGCAQHRAMHPRPDRRWTMEQIRWWGGWIQSESNEVLMRYILEAHDRQQKYFGDSLDPYRNITAVNHPNNVPNGAAPESLATVADVHVLEHKTQLLIQQLRTSMESHMQSLMASIGSLASATQVLPSTQSVVVPVISGNPGSTVDLTAETDEEQGQTVTSQTTAPVVVPVLPRHLGKAPVIHPVKNIPGALRQWTHAQPPFHPYALKDWPNINPAWLKQRTVSSKYSARRLLYKGFSEVCDHDIGRFYHRFGTSISKALDRIRTHFGLGREGRKGIKYKSRPRPHRAARESTPELLANNTQGTDVDEEVGPEDLTDSPQSSPAPMAGESVIPPSSSASPSPTGRPTPRLGPVANEDSSDSEYGSPLSPGILSAQVQAAEAIERTASQVRRVSGPVPRRSGRAKSTSKRNKRRDE